MIGPEGRVHEIYHNAPPDQHEGGELASTLTGPVSLLRRMSHNQAYMTMIDAAPYVIAAQSVKGAQGEVTLMLISPIDNQFLKEVSTQVPQDTVLALIDPDTGVVLFSSDEQMIEAGSKTEVLGSRFLLTGKSFFDYGASDLNIQFASFIATANAKRLAERVVSESQRQRVFTAFVLVLSFALLSLWLAQRINNLTQDVVKFSDTFLDIELPIDQRGDEIDVLDGYFRKFSHEIVDARDSLYKKMEESEQLAERLQKGKSELEHFNAMLKGEIAERLLRERELEQAREEAIAASGAKSEFLSYMSHELRTPLNAILGFSQVLELEELDESQAQMVSDIYKSGMHLLELINDVLDLSKIEAGRFDISFGEVNLGDLVSECMVMMNPLAANRELTLRVEPSQLSAVILNADKVRLKQVLLNLLSNAVKYNRRGGFIAITAEPVHDCFYRISVTDNGLGIPKERQDELFEAFNRIEAEGTHIEGTGIGLVISKRIAELMGGTLGFESESGQGSTFWVEIGRFEQPLLKKMG
ncbi:sensor histidine kinase [Solemya pervernicosa gill symbiont]|uniref:sensor histidine kinase n=1 Tax=Solemya pervernicosa gill symbiont TaxID=642797 RepID=UPI00156081AF|nr:ATP-binding protein [Solemya pervernicosa gill symbiont]